MNFVSVEFFVLAAIVLALLPLLAHRNQNIVILIASYVFYGWWNWRYLPLIIIISLIDYYCAFAIDSTKIERRRKLYLAIGLCANIGILAYFKYTDFLIDTVNVVAGTHWPLLHILLPIGVSFHTFQSMSYTIDVYRRKILPIRNPLDYQLFVTFFPQLVAGPIERATQLLPQVLTHRKTTQYDVADGLALILRGYFKKVVIADNLAPIVDAVYASGSSRTGLAVVFATYAFALQIYCDFSGYTDIARGVARLMGFRLMENFKQPYFATNPSDFWRRWHISLSTWLRDYLYIPLGGNRHGELRTYVALSLTMLIGGIWHGASWTFVLWGAYHGLALVIYRAFFRNRQRLPTWAKPIAIVAFFQFTCFGWMLFRAQTFENFSSLFASLVSSQGWTQAHPYNVSLLAACAVAVFVIDIWHEKRLRLPIPFWLKPAAFTLTCIAILLWAPENVSSFIYFQF
ncbi:MAG: MBOAT family protein [Bradyrhizobium sp.]|uniref:MBOAT family O-acyltransferase n=1 Tax=Bradyrhizobium sp. TaxID=376 RepID=UPI003D10F5D8